MLRKPWILTQTWQDVLFLHWPVPPAMLEQHIPIDLKVDLFEQNAWLSIVLFKVNGQRIRLLPAFPGTDSYVQLNIRTYVTYRGKQGIYFFNLDVTNRFVAQLASMGGLKYRYAKMALQLKDNSYFFTSHSNKFKERARISYKPLSSETPSSSFDKWLVERYCSWTKSKNVLLRIDIHHLPWQLQKAQINIESNTLAPFTNEMLQRTQPIVHYAKCKKTNIFPPVVEHKNQIH